ncbi:helix-turn-helix transcriptional regulator [Hymenobacter crusticola]|uniref:Helix-turn-helix domain-containing protein n=1 Tax=Hymenobacter crusticola TaxID=1770526 RepID=A0A2C9ZTU0_9BACT|nr:hypothetical protein BXP70_28185 [Hymenobacter crusticola]
MDQTVVKNLGSDVLLEKIRAIVRDELGQIQPIAETEQLLTLQETADLLSCSLATIHDLKRRNILPFYKLAGGRVYLKKSEVLNALQSQ